MAAAAARASVEKERERKNFLIPIFLEIFLFSFWLVVFFLFSLIPMRLERKKMQKVNILYRCCCCEHHARDAAQKRNVK